MNVGWTHRHACCAHTHAAAAHHGWLMGVLGVGVVVAAMFGVVRTVDRVVWGQAYKPHVVDGNMLRTPDPQVLAGYGGAAPEGRFRPVTDRIFGR